MASPLLAQVNEKPVMKGWITKVYMHFVDYVNITLSRGTYFTLNLM